MIDFLINNTDLVIAVLSLLAIAAKILNEQLQCTITRSYKIKTLLTKGNALWLRKHIFMPFQDTLQRYLFATITKENESKILQWCTEIYSLIHKDPKFRYIISTDFTYNLEKYLECYKNDFYCKNLEKEKNYRFGWLSRSYLRLNNDVRIVLNVYPTNNHAYTNLKNYKSTAVGSIFKIIYMIAILLIAILLILLFVNSLIK